ncbi:MAG: DJ-1/PfpI family protein [Proteobacteria bacterium]|nr:DJ-1/PfpI family protein [Pseudomonadota bacterium]
MRTAILLFDGFDEVDAFVTLGLLNRLKAQGWKAEIASPSAQVTSMNGTTVVAQQPLEFANEASAVVFPSCLYARAIAQNSALLDRLQLDPLRQRIGAIGSGALLLARLGLLADLPACTDAATKPWLVQAGVRVEDAPFLARGPIATAGGSLAAPYVAAWLTIHGAGLNAATRLLQGAAPVGAQADYVERLVGVVRPFLEAPD